MGNDIMNLICPLDGESIVHQQGNYICESCKTQFPIVDVENREIPDFRCLDRITQTTLTFTIPQNPLPTIVVDHFGKATSADFQCLSREAIRKKYGTKLDKEILYYINIAMEQFGKSAYILDLGCGTGGNKKYLNSVGFNNIISVDYRSSEAEFLVDVHRLPFGKESFDMILTTATLEHFYNPYVAFKEMNRVLKTDGILIASGSFWEKWHGNSCFHFTPGGIDLLCHFSAFELKDMWSGWGFIPSIASHALGLSRFKKYTYFLQKIFDAILSRIASPETAKKHKFSTSGSFGLFARKIASNNL
jgi:ubiquinone/menaquinone biosynthesis C-methylase UbiE